MANVNKAKDVKKKGRRLKRSIRKTLGTLFLVSALVVAAIPVDYLQATNVEEGIVPYDYDSENEDISCETEKIIPQMNEDGSTKIYTSADHVVQFAYLNDGSGYGAVVVGYNSGYLEGGKLDLTGTIDAYGQYRINDATGYNYAAVGLNGNFLFYKNREQHTYTGGTDAGSGINVAQYTTNNPNFISEIRRETDPTSGNVISLTILEEVGSCQPCYIETANIWSAFGDGELYYDDNDRTGDNPNNNNPQYLKVGNNADYQRIKNAHITYISNQYIEEDDNGKWRYGRSGTDEKFYGGTVDEEHKGKGIFANKNNVQTLTVSNYFKGVGDYAFYNSGLNEITLANGLICVGNHAFESCRSLTTANFDVTCNLLVLGKSAFQDCQVLTSFVLPSAVTQIGSFAFKGCMAMTSMDLCSGGNVNALRELGRGVFEDCESLQSLTFPNNCDDAIYMSTFQGCRSLQWIAVRNKNTTFLVDNGGFTYDDFRSQVTDEFYFEGLGTYPPTWDYETAPSTLWDSQVHKLAYDEHFAFSYLDYQSNDDPNSNWYPKQDHYELTTEEKTATGGAGKNTFVVNSAGILERYTCTGNVHSLTVPRKIGPYVVATIDAGVFENSCNLEKVTVPETVATIKTNAFRGCHNLEDVIFESGNILIESDAFRTQDFTGTEHKNCSTGEVTTESGTNKPMKVLHFTGPMTTASAPFNYAMSKEGRYNNNSQADSYIIYYSGWPQNLEVQYNPQTEMSELKDFPSLAELGTKYTSANYAYITPEYEQAAAEALSTYESNPSALTPNQQAIINSALAVEIPEGVYSVEDGLIKRKDDLDKNDNKTITAYTLRTVKEAVYDKEGKLDSTKSTFAGCEYLKGIYLLSDANGDGTVEIEEHAFEGCKNLTDVAISPSVSEMGNCPFYGCEKLTNVNCQNNPIYSCEDSILYESKDGRKTIVECLPGRAKAIRASELEGVTALKDEAFRGSNVKEVDLSSTTIDTITEEAFADTPELYKVTLPHTCYAIKNYAFRNSGLTMFVASSILDDFETDCFTGLKNTNDQVTIVCDQGTRAERYARDHGFDVSNEVLDRYYTVVFWDWNSELGQIEQVDEQQVLAGDDAIPPEPRGKEGEEFFKWLPEYHEVYADIPNCTAYYREPSEARWTVTFRDDDGTLIDTKEVVNEGNAEVVAPVSGVDFNLEETRTFVGWKADGDLRRVTDNLTAVANYKTEGEHLVEYYARKGSISAPWGDPFYSLTVKEGENAPNLSPPADYTVEGYTFTGWDKPLENITEPTKLYASYEPNFGINTPDPGNTDNPGNQTPDPGNTDNPGNQTPGPGNTDNPGNQSPGPSQNPGGQSPSPNPGGSPRPDGTYWLEVYNGSGSGYYVPGAQIVITADPAPEGQRFIGWDVSPAATVVTDKTRNVTIVTMPRNDAALLAKYESTSGNDDDNNEKLYSLQVSGGSGSGVYPAGTQVIITANAPAENQEFTGWDVSPAETVVTDKTRTSTILTMPEGDVAAIANYRLLTEPTPTPAPSQTPAPTPAALHSLIVHNGSGSGSYVAGAQIVIVANDPAAGQEFTGWTVSPDNTVISDKTLSGAVITMPDNDVAVIANYRARATGSGNTGSGNTTNTNNSGNNSNNNNSNSGSNSNTNTNRPSGSTSTNTGTSNRGGTTVVIDKNGLSNTGVVSATVNGSSDNFTIKITESSEATSAVLNALLAEYGNVDNIKYFPMDISLYDSTGNTKITDTTGLSVSITLPLPDSLITYAGNNKVAGVVNDRLDKLTPRFTTINGVSCITFTAEHFSPYVIYVDVANLSSGTATDATPTTGDGIHPKWFLSIGLACMSFVMFMMKDGGKASDRKRKVKVRV